MIEEYLKVIEPKIKGEIVPCIFLNDTFLDPVEWHLLETGRYDRGLPKDYGGHQKEREGYRWLKNPVKGNYEDIPITLARTILHLKSRENGVFIDTLVFLYDNDLESIGAMSSVYLLQDGFILSTYDLLEPANTATNCWNPGTENTPASAPYPSSFLKVYFDLRNSIDQLPVSKDIMTKLKFSKPCEVAGRLVMLCVAAAREVGHQQIVYL